MHTHILPGGHREHRHGGRIGCPVCMLVRMCVFMCVCARARVRVRVIDRGVCACVWEMDALSITHFIHTQTSTHTPWSMPQWKTWVTARWYEIAALLQHSLQHSPKHSPQHNTATHYCNTLLQHTTATHHCNTPLQHTAVTHSVAEEHLFIASSTDSKGGALMRSRGRREGKSIGIAYGSGTWW